MITMATMTATTPQNPAGHRQNHINGGAQRRAGVRVFHRGPDLVAQLGENHAQTGYEFLHASLLSPANSAGLSS